MLFPPYGTLVQVWGSERDDLGTVMYGFISADSEQRHRIARGTDQILRPAMLQPLCDCTLAQVPAMFPAIVGSTLT